MSEISRKVAIVTGAGHGIGLEIVKALLREKIRVLATSRHIDALKDLEGKDLLLTPADLTDDNSFERIVSDCVAAFGGIDIVINNAGYGKKVLLTDTSREEWDRHMAVNVRAPFMLVNAAMPYLQASTHATVINICSVVSHKGYAMQGRLFRGEARAAGVHKGVGARDIRSGHSCPCHLAGRRRDGDDTEDAPRSRPVDAQHAGGDCRYRAVSAEEQERRRDRRDLCPAAYQGTVGVKRGADTL